MILNAFSVVAVFAALLRVGIALAILFVGARALRRRSETGDPLLLLLAATLVGLALVSWPLLYLVLQSYVPEWPGVMCIQGVTLIGEGSVGAASHLPWLVTLLEWTKPALVFAAGLWLVLHLANRRAGAYRGRVIAALLLCGLLAVLDGAAELTYVFIPKQEKFLAAGCCAPGTWVAGDTASVARPQESTAGLTWGFFTTGLVLAIAVTAAIRSLRGGGRDRLWLMVALAGAIVSLPLGLAFLGAVAAPAFLRLPRHACAYCAIASAPESLLGITLFVAGAFGVGWACTARWIGTAQAHVCIPLLRFARFGYFAALAMTAVRLVFP